MRGSPTRENVVRIAIASPGPTRRKPVLDLAVCDLPQSGWVERGHHEVHLVELLQTFEKVHGVQVAHRHERLSGPCEARARETNDEIPAQDGNLRKGCLVDLPRARLIEPLGLGLEVVQQPCIADHRHSVVIEDFGYHEAHEYI